MAKSKEQFARDQAYLGARYETEATYSVPTLGTVMELIKLTEYTDMVFEVIAETYGEPAPKSLLAQLEIILDNPEQLAGYFLVEVLKNNHEAVELYHRMVEDIAIERAERAEECAEW